MADSASIAAAPSSANNIALTFPDGARREYPQGITGLDIAKGISPSLAKRTVAMALDGTLADLADPIEQDAKIEFVTRDDPRALELIRHDAAHVLAEAVQALWPGTQVTIGPVIENGFYYDFVRNEPFTPEDFPAIEAKMREIIARDTPFTKEVWAATKAKHVFERQGRAVQGRAGRRDPGRRGPQDLQAGRLVRPLPRPAHDLDRQDRQRLQADEGRGRLLARRCQQPDAARASTAPPGPSRRSSTPTSSSSRRPRSATTASSAARWTCSISRRRGPGVVFWHAEGLGAVPGRSSPTCAGASKAATRRSTRRRSSTSRCGRPRATGSWFRENMFAAQSAATRPRTSAGSPSSR